MDEQKSELWVGGLEGLKGKYLKSLCEIQREGIPALATYLIQETDFFTAPGSANNHNAYEGGLVEHSLLVMINAIKLGCLYAPGTKYYDSIVLSSLLHDVCKVNFYKRYWKPVKQVNPETGEDLLNEYNKPIWFQEPRYTIEDALPYGHGEKSVMIVQEFVKLTEQEKMAIRWHMAGYDDTARSYSGGLALGNAMNKYGLITILHMADLASIYLEESNIVDTEICSNSITTCTFRGTHENNLNACLFGDPPAHNTFSCGWLINNGDCPRGLKK